MGEDLRFLSPVFLRKYCLHINNFTIKLPSTLLSDLSIGDHLKSNTN